MINVTYSYFKELYQNNGHIKKMNNSCTVIFYCVRKKTVLTSSVKSYSARRPASGQRLWYTLK